MNILLEYRESDGWLHHLYDQKAENTNGFFTLCNNISAEQGLEFGRYLHNKYDFNKEIPCFEEVKETFVEFLNT